MYNESIKFLDKRLNQNLKSQADEMLYTQQQMQIDVDTTWTIYMC